MRRILVGVVAASWVALVSIVGCSNDDPVTAPPPSGGTVADSPANALRAMAAASEARDTLAYRGLFTSDYTFDIVPADTVGTGLPVADLDWDAEMQFASRCFRAGTAQLFPAQSILFVVDTSLVAVPDARPGKNGTWHQQVDCTAHVTVDAIDTVFEVVQQLRVYTTRGDSAQVTPEIRGTGGLPDAERWYIDHIEPLGLVSGTTLGRLKLAYLAL